MTKISISFNNFDVLQCIGELDIRHKSKTDASHGLPASDAIALSQTEIEIEDRIINFYSAQILNSNAPDLEESLQNSASLRQADGHTGQISSLKIHLQALYAECKERLSAQYKIYRKDKEYLEFFRMDNNLAAKANLRTNGQKTFSILVVLAMFIFEVSVNASLMSGAISGGLFGALALASVIAFVNIVASFMIGRLVVPNLYHRLKSKVRMSWITLSLYIPLILYINFALGVFRTLSERAAQTFSLQELQNVAQKAAWPFDNLADNTLDSNGLIIIGILFAIIAILDGLYFDEIYPGYAKVSRGVEKSEEELNALKKEIFDLFNVEQSRGNTQITNFKNTREQANKAWAHNIDSVQYAFNNYEIWVKSLEKAGNNLLQQYRSNNKAFRSSSAPPYFSEIHDFGFERNAVKRFPSLVSANITDEEKSKEFTEVNKIIITEYNNAITELNTIYSDTLEEYQDYLSRFK